MFFIEENCPVCEDGLIGFLKCNDEKTIVLMCEECCSVWFNPKDVVENAPIFPQAPDFELPGSKVSISGKYAAWASYEEVSATDLREFISKDREYVI